MTDELPPEPELVEVTVTCTTETCMNFGIPITLTIPLGTPVWCGPCGAQLA